MRVMIWLGAVLLLAGCATPASRNGTADVIQREMNQVAQDSVQPRADVVNNALLPPLVASMPRLANQSLETRFDLTEKNTPVQQVFMAIVSGTRYSMLLHPDVSG